MLSAIEVKASVLSCKSCSLHTGCNYPVYFDGPAPNDIAIIGEAPGATEDRLHKPFVGPSGQLLKGWLKEYGIESATFLNSVSCFPHRTPRYSEVEACRNNLWSQLQVIQPKYILLVGTTAISSWWKDIGVTELRGGFWQAYWKNDSPEKGDKGEGWSWAFATYHPAAVLRNRGLETQTKEDIERFADVALGKVETVPLINTCVKCGDEEVRYVVWGVPYCWWCWPENRLKHGAGRVKQPVDSYGIKKGTVPPFIGGGDYMFEKWVKEVNVQGELL